MRKGDFSGIVNGSGILQQLYDPSTTYSTASCPYGTSAVNVACRQQFANNQVPYNSISPASKILYDIMPLPTTNDNPLVANNLIAINPSFTVVPTITFRIDHSFNEDNKAYLRYTSNNQTTTGLNNYPSNAAGTIAADGIPAKAANYSATYVTNFGAAGGYTHVFSPTFFAETILSQQWFMQYIGSGGNQKLNYESMLGLPNNFGAIGFPGIGTRCSSAVAIVTSASHIFQDGLRTLLPSPLKPPRSWTPKPIPVTVRHRTPATQARISFLAQPQVTHFILRHFTCIITIWSLTPTSRTTGTPPRI
jgi:hypothetical protein